MAGNSGRCLTNKRIARRGRRCNRFLTQVHSASCRATTGELQIAFASRSELCCERPAAVVHNSGGRGERGGFVLARRPPEREL